MSIANSPTAALLEGYLGTPEGYLGSYIIFTDSIPLLAISGRLLYRVTGLVMNPFGAWAVFCLVGSAMSMTGLLATIGQRGIAAGLAATAFGLCRPPLLERWGHIALMAQWEIPLAFTIYFWSVSRQPTIGLVALSMLLATVALWTHVYLFAMVMGILAAALTQALVDERLTVVSAASIITVFAGTLVGLMFMSGHLSNPSPLDADGFGTYSMNILSPVVPQFSATNSLLRDGVLDATGGQYEGFNYLGAGLLLLLIETRPRLTQALAAAWRRHGCLMGLLLAFTMFAISNQIYLGNWHIVTIPLPSWSLSIAGIFRSSGRFFWPCAYLLGAAAIAATLTSGRRFAGCLLVVAAIVQVVDIGPLRAGLANCISAPAATWLPEDRWADAIRQHDFVRVVPPFECLSDPSGRAYETAIALQFLASRENVPTNTVYAARQGKHCTGQDVAFPTPSELRVYLLSDPSADLFSEDKSRCAVSPKLAVCSQRLGSPEIAGLLTTTP